MPGYFAFLRAINVGGRVVKMERLRAIFGELGLANVQTLIASGNLIFDSRSRTPANLERKIERALENALGYQVHTFVRTAADLRGVADFQPFSKSDLSNQNHSLYIAFLRKAPSIDCANRLLACRSNFEDFHIQDREIYWLCRGKLTDSKLSGPKLERILKASATVRNFKTVKKLVDAHCPV